jgi:predicted PP-loop superfamily ATPase
MKCEHGTEGCTGVGEKHWCGRCKCMDVMNKALAPRNAELDTAFNVYGDVYPRLSTRKVNTRVRDKGPMVLPTFCPFCGVKYEFRDEAKAAKKKTAKR